MRRLRPRLTYANVMSTVAVFLALTGGTAFALSGSNTVFSDDITNNEVRTGDVRNDDLTNGGLVSGDIRANALTGSDVSALTGGDVNDDSLTGADVTGLTGTDVTDNSLTGADVDETTLATVPSARELGTPPGGRDSSDFPTRVGSGQFGTADLQWHAEFLDTTEAADHNFPSVILKTTGTAGQFRVCEVPGAGVIEFTIYVNGTRTQHNTLGTGGCASTTFDPGNRGDFEILARRTRIVGWDHSSLADAENYTTYALVGPSS